MAYIGILSDTHAYLGDYVFRFFDNCDEIWHAGDIGSLDVLTALQQFKPIRAVWGNIDGSPIKNLIPAVQMFKYQGLRVFMRHIVGYPNKYENSVIPTIQSTPFDLIIAGHSHILRIMHDRKYNFLFINPGAAGIYGSHTKITLVKLEIQEGKIKDAFIWEKNK